MDGSTGGQDTGHWLPLREAAAALGVDLAALRKRAQRGTAPARKAGAGVWFVRVDTRVGHGLPTGQDGQDTRLRSVSAITDSPLVDELRATVADLRRRLDHSERAQDELRQLLAAAISAARQLPEQTTRSEAATAPEMEAVGQSVVRTPEAPQQPPERPWWAFWRRAVPST